MEYPDEAVVRFLAELRRSSNVRTVLDWGCATGRHSLAALRFGFDVIGVDVSNVCVETTKRKAAAIFGPGVQNRARFFQIDGFDVPSAADASIDAVVARGAVYLDASPTSIKKIFLSIHRILRNGGKVFVDFKTEKDSVCQNARSGDKLFRLSKNDDASPLVYIPGPGEVEEMFRSCGLDAEKTDRCEYTLNDGAVTYSTVQYVAVKR